MKKNQKRIFSNNPKNPVADILGKTIVVGAGIFLLISWLLTRPTFWLIVISILLIKYFITY